MGQNSSKGFTLVEMMLCILVMSIGLLAISRMQVSSIKGNAKATDLMRANMITAAAADQLECSQYSGAALSAVGVATLASPDPRYTVTYTVTNVSWDPSAPADPSRTYKLIVLTTTWYDLGQNLNPNISPNSIVRMITVSNCISTSADNA